MKGAHVLSPSISLLMDCSFHEIKQLLWNGDKGKRPEDLDPFTHQHGEIIALTKYGDKGTCFVVQLPQQRSVNL
jgi:hypothetical protein